MGYKGAREDLTYERAHEVFSYNPETGVFRYKADTYRRIKRAGDIAGWQRPDRRIMINCDGKEYRAHRLAWLMMTGSWPEFEIDHEDLDPSNNRWTNLRAATSSQNQAHRGTQKNNKSGYTGVFQIKSTGHFAAYIKWQKQRIHIGVYGTAEEAHAAYAEMAKQLHGEFANHALPYGLISSRGRAPEL